MAEIDGTSEMCLQMRTRVLLEPLAPATDLVSMIVVVGIGTIDSLPSKLPSLFFRDAKTSKDVSSFA